LDSILSGKREMQSGFIVASVAAIVTFMSLLPCSTVVGEEARLFGDLLTFIEKRESEFDLISVDRKDQLDQLSDYLRECQSSGTPVRLIFVCTHNSRRSHMSQLWAAVAAVRYGLENVETFSGGTECTAFNPRAVSAMQRAGFEVEIQATGVNPVYLVSFATNRQPETCFSKIYSDQANPLADFCAIMTCSSADSSCPTVKGAVKRVAIPYEDPKVADDSPDEASTYDERSAQICRELLYAFSRSRKPSN